MRQCVAIMVLLVTHACSFVSAADFPHRPIKIVVYTNPGGLVDISARKLAHILEQHFVTTPVVVENKKGAGGLVALQHVLRQRADGYTVLALTSSVISKAVQAHHEQKLNELTMLARLVDDYECLIVRKQGKYSSLLELTRAVQDPKRRTIWAGPAAGGTDNLFARSYWKVVGGRGVWIPYRSGGQAIASVLGGHSDVYVGNPQDVRGRSSLQILAVTAPARLKRYPEVPTFEEFGYRALTGKSLWRGFAIRKETPPDVQHELLSLFKKAAQSNEWQTFVAESGAQSIFDSEEVFRQVVVSQVRAEKDLL